MRKCTSGTARSHDDHSRSINRRPATKTRARLRRRVAGGVPLCAHTRSLARSMCVFITYLPLGALHPGSPGTSFTTHICMARTSPEYIYYFIQQHGRKTCRQPSPPAECVSGVAHLRHDATATRQEYTNQDTINKEALVHKLTTTYTRLTRYSSSVCSVLKNVTTRFGFGCYAAESRCCAADDWRRTEANILRTRRVTRVIRMRCRRD